MKTGTTKEWNHEQRQQAADAWPLYRHRPSRTNGTLRIAVMFDETVTTALTEKIQRQDRFIAELQAELQRARDASVETMLGQFRLREAVLLYVVQDAGSFAQQIAVNFGSEVARAVPANLFVLDNAPVPPEVCESIRKAINHGMSRW